ncbi:hypothetical protein FGM00_02595 [Aggregatimonas sangjinii]|uniref:SMP-30/Gluconolactonase/LRE-like region domain-containing protein n=1 Tax=Aggregatimonas sangjinii TaxID=2583587 RepID=A0A5B7SPX2_9FLAO|nr:hypothetical protein [Aggregatimonas sangjinii]QCW99057.1 hypothetical protein FGM00_02595 [Aggregatimonas sangjinii]
MKTSKGVQKNNMVYVMIVTCIFIQYSCSDYYEQLFERKSKNARVETLVQDFQASDGLSVDKNGTIFASNYAGFMGTEVLKVNPRTATVEVAVNDLRAPTGNVVDRFGNIFVVNNVRRLSPDSNELQGDVLKVLKDGTRTVIGTLPGFPSGITLDHKGNVYVSNFYFSGVHKITPDGEVSVFVQDDRLYGGVGIDFDNKGNLFVGNFSTGDILKISPDKSLEVLATIPTVREGFVIGYITYFGESIFATAVGEHVIYRVSMSGEAKIFAGSGIQESVDGKLMEASFDTPNGITADPKRKVLYVTEGGESAGALRVLKFK